MSKIETATAVVEIAHAEQVFAEDEAVTLDAALPSGALQDMVTEFDCANLEDVDVLVENYISEDGGKTWSFNGSFERKAGSASVDRNGKPTTVCGGWFKSEVGDPKQVEKIQDGALIRSVVTVTKGGSSGKITHQIKTELGKI